jgi:hypothetical protein
VRPYGIVRIDSATSVTAWDKDPKGNTKLIAQTFREAGKIAKGEGERLAAEGEICWGGMHSWKHMVNLLEEVGMPKVVGFQADMSHTLLYTLGYNAEAHRSCRRSYHWEPARIPQGDDQAHRMRCARGRLISTSRKTTAACSAPAITKRPAALSRHRPEGKLNIARDSGYWLRDAKGKVTKKLKHICWDGCMFPNEVMMKQQTWNDILAAMIQVRENHGWKV